MEWILFLFLSRLNKIFDIGYFPDSRFEGYVIPLHKRGEINDANIYRGITLLSCIDKLFTRILNNRLCKWAELYNAYEDAQCGVRAKVGTTDIFLCCID